MQRRRETEQALARVDWSKTALGPREAWPQSLLTTVSLVQDCETPMSLFWGPDAVMLYNDAFVPILGKHKHPGAMGISAKVNFAETWSVIGPLIDSVRSSGQGVHFADMLIFLERDGFLEENYFDFSYSPVRGEAGEVTAVLDVVIETTQRVIAERQLRTLRELNEADASDEETVCRTAALALANNPNDLPFALLALHEGSSFRLVAQCARGQTDLVDFGKALLGQLDANLLAKASAPVRLEGLRESLPEAFPSSEFGLPDQAVVYPLRPASPGDGDSLNAVLLLGMSPRRRDNEVYQRFFDLIADSLSAILARSIAAQEEQRRMEALRALDRAKTDFFFNVSHEFRTPLTLMLGPLHVLLEQESVSSSTRRELEMLERNTGRLLKLVNNLLDVSRLEARKLEARLEPVDLAALTADIAGTFRSSIEGGGLEFTVECPPLSRYYQVDPEMWEKIVSNLLSNAFKFTLEGGIRLSLVEEPEGPILSIGDTGSGIEAGDVPHLFDRFHRTQTVLARSHEGTGIGLSLVDELSRLLGGAVSVQSEPGVGSLFTVQLPTALATTELPTAIHAANRTALSALSEMLGQDSGDTVAMPASVASEEKFGKVLVVDDNADMREFARRALAPYYDLRLAKDGVEALELVEASVPDLIVSDIMMPRCDGLQMLQKLRQAEATRVLPVLLMSARAGEGAQSAGLEAGADDYLVKPFSRRQLQSRVRSLLDRSREHRYEALREQEMARQFSQLAQASLTVGKAQTIDELLVLTAEQAGLLVGASYASCQLRLDASSMQQHVLCHADTLTFPLLDEFGEELAVLTLADLETAPLSGTRQAMLSQLGQLAACVLERLRR